jgi:hypothetical protein
VARFRRVSMFHNPLPAFRREYWSTRFNTVRLALRGCTGIYSYRAMTVVRTEEYQAALASQD